MALVVLVLAGGGAAAEEAGVTEARAMLDEVDKGLAALVPGDVPAANALILRVNAAKSKLSGCKARTAPEWVEQAKRANALDPQIRARLKGADGAPIAPDAPTREAMAALDKVVAKLATLTPGDTATANGLIREINAARDLLSKSALRVTQEWKDSAARADALDKQVRARLAASVPVEDGPPTNAPPLGRDDGYLYRRDFETPFKAYQADLDALDARALADPVRNKAAMLRAAAARMRTALGKLSDPQHALVTWALGALDRFEARLDAKLAEGQRLLAEDRARAEAEASEVEGQLAAIEAFFDPTSFRCDLEPPYGADRVREWVTQLRAYEVMKGKGLAQLERLEKEHPRYAGHPRLKKLRWVFGEQLPRSLEEGARKTLAALAHRVDAAKWLLAEGTITPERLADDRWVAEQLERGDSGIEAAEALVVYAEAHHAAQDDAAAKAVIDLSGAVERLRGGAARALANARMPQSRSTDPELEQIARELLADAKTGAGPWRRLVLNADKKHEVAERAEARLDGDSLRITRWTEEWDQFQVCLAEEVKGELRCVYYTLKYLHRGPPWMPVGRWYLRERIVSHRLLPENVDK